MGELRGWKGKTYRRNSIVDVEVGLGLGLAAVVGLKFNEPLKGI